MPRCHHATMPGCQFEASSENATWRRTESHEEKCVCLCMCLCVCLCFFFHLRICLIILWILGNCFKQVRELWEVFYWMNIRNWRRHGCYECYSFALFIYLLSPTLLQLSLLCGKSFNSCLHFYACFFIFSVLHIVYHQYTVELNCVGYSETICILPICAICSSHSCRDSGFIRTNSQRDLT